MWYHISLHKCLLSAVFALVVLGKREAAGVPTQFSSVARERGLAVLAPVQFADIGSHGSRVPRVVVFLSHFFHTPFFLGLRQIQLYYTIKTGKKQNLHNLYSLLLPLLML